MDFERPVITHSDCIAGIINNMDVNTKDCSYQYKHRDYPEAPRPLLAASWESGNLDTVNAIMELKPDTRTLWSPEYESKNRPKPVFFQVSIIPLFPADTRIRVNMPYCLARVLSSLSSNQRGRKVIKDSFLNIVYHIHVHCMCMFVHGKK